MISIILLLLMMIIAELIGYEADAEFCLLGGLL